MAGFCEIVSKIIRLLFDFIIYEEQKDILCTQCKDKIIPKLMDLDTDLNKTN